MLTRGPRELPWGDAHRWLSLAEIRRGSGRRSSAACSDVTTAADDRPAGCLFELHELTRSAAHQLAGRARASHTMLTSQWNGTRRKDDRRGAAHGFGRAIGLAFARRGGNVWACDVLEDELHETEHLCRRHDGACTARVVDVRNRGDVDAFVREAGAAAGRLDVLVNNAGGVLGQVGRPLEQIRRPTGRRSSTSTSSGAFYCSQAVAPG